MKDCPTTLELMSTDDIVEELTNRFDHYVFSGLKVCDVKGNVLIREWSGDEFTVRGLAMEIIQRVEDECKVVPEEEIDDDDD